MAAKPTQDPKWVTSDDPNEIIEPSPALKTNGVQSGGIWGREHLNWMFNALSRWIDWVRSFAMDKDNNLNDVSDKPAAFNNIKQNATTTSTGVVEAATSSETTVGTSNKFPDAAKVKEVTDTKLTKSSNLSDVGSTTTAFNNIKQNATTTSTGVVEKATVSEITSNTANKFPDAADLGEVYLKKSQTLTTSEVTAARQMLGIYTGVITGSGSSGGLPSGWSVARLSTGRYEVAHNTSKYYTVSCDPSGSDEQFAKFFATEDESLQKFVIRSFSSNGSAQDVTFTFLAVSR